MILVIGATGQVGRALARLDPTLTAIGRPRIDLARSPSIERVMLELRPRVVINAAAHTDVDAAESDIDAAMAINADGAARIAAAAARVDAAVLHLSTDYVFDGTKGAPYSESDAPNPINVYGQSKLAGEKAVLDANALGVVVRTSWLYSTNGKSFVRSIMQRASKGKPVEVVNDVWGSPSFADHLAAGLHTLARALVAKRAALPRIIHLAGTGVTSRYDFAKAILRASRAMGGPSADLTPVGSAHFHLPARRPQNTALDCTLAQEAAGVRMPDWREGLDQCMRDIAANGWRFV